MKKWRMENCILRSRSSKLSCGRFDRDDRVKKVGNGPLAWWKQEGDRDDFSCDWITWALTPWLFFSPWRPENCQRNALHCICHNLYARSFLCRTPQKKESMSRYINYYTGHYCLCQWLMFSTESNAFSRSSSSPGFFIEDVCVLSVQLI